MQTFIIILVLVVMAYGAYLIVTSRPAGSQPTTTTTPPLPGGTWKAGTAYAVGDKVILSTGGVLTNATASKGGVSGYSQPFLPPGGQILDGTVTWQYTGPA